MQGLRTHPRGITYAGSSRAWGCFALTVLASSAQAVGPVKSSPEPVLQPWMEWAAVAIAVVIGLVAGFVLWNVRLQTLVRRRTAQLEAKNRALLAERADHQKTTAEALRLTQIFEASTDFVGTCDPEGRLQWVNPAGLELVGLSETGVQGKTCADIVAPWALKHIKEEAIPAAIRTGRWQGESAFLSPTKGEVRISQLILTHRGLGGELQFLSTVARDITQLKQAEIELRQSRQRLELINTIATSINAGADVSTVIRVVMRALANVMPRFRIRWCSLTPGGAFVVEESIEPAPMTSMQGLAGDLSVAPEYLEDLRADRAVPVTDASTDPRMVPLAGFLASGGIAATLARHVHTGQLEGLLCIDSTTPRQWTTNELATISEVSDYLVVAITGASSVQDRLHAQESLRFSEERLRLIIENMPVLAFAISPLGRIVFWNKEAQRVTGYSDEEIATPHGLEMLLPDPIYRAGVLTEWSTPPSKVRDFEWNISCKDGTTRTIAWSSIAEQVPIPGWKTWGIAVDITQRKMAEEMVRQSEERYRLLFESSPQPMWIYDTTTLRFLSVNSAAVRDYGFTRDEFSRMTLRDIRPESEVPELLHVVSTLGSAHPSETGVWRHRKKNGTEIEVQISSHSVPFIGENARLVLVTDVTARNRAMSALRESRALLEQAQAVAHIGSWVADLTGSGSLKWSRETCRIFGVPEQDEYATTIDEFFTFVHPDDIEHIKDAETAAMVGGGAYSIDHRIIRPDGQPRWVHEQAEIERDSEGRPTRMVGVVQDITEARRHELWRTGQAKVFEQLTAGDPLSKVLETLVLAIEAQKSGLRCSILLLDDSGQRLRLGAAPNLPPEFNTAVEGYPVGPANGSCGTAAFRRERVIVSDIANDPLWVGGRELAARSSLAAAWAQPIFGGSGSLLGTFAMYYPTPREPNLREIELIESAAHLAGLAISRRRDEQRLQERAEELARSNAELERFAYVASHDLQEPLRMVTSFTQLLAQRYKGRLDKDADEFIGFAVEGAVRMQQLIEDLLAFSRVSSRPRVLGRVQAASALARARDNLRHAIESSGAEVKAAELPEVMADELQLAMVFQNLIGNAIKFRAPGVPPIVEVKAAHTDGKWQFQVSDNGIGIEPKHREKIFTMFQRLHPRSVYPGNGIGLAICKRILERHNGRIWVESDPGAGSTFYFTLPDAGVTQ